MAAIVKKDNARIRMEAWSFRKSIHFSRGSGWMDGFGRRKHFKIIIQEESTGHEHNADPLAGHIRRPTDGETEIMRDPAPQSEHQNVKQKQEKEFALKNSIDERNIVFH